MNRIEYICKNCGGNKVFVRPSGRRMAVYCANCETYICPTTYTVAQSIYKEMNPEDLSDSLSMRKFRKCAGATVMECSRCGCLLYNSAFKKIEGQFDLVNARFCPDCGRKLV